MKHVYYCRHGLSVMNAQGLLAGSTDTPLADKGREQARKAGEAAAKVKPDVIIASPLLRAYETAQIIAEACHIPPEKIIVSPLVVERDFGNLEGTPWVPGRNFDNEPSVEPYEHIMERARKAKALIDALPDKKVLLVSHGAFIRAIRSLYQPELPYANATANMPNAEIVRMV